MNKKLVLQRILKRCKCFLILESFFLYEVSVKQIFKIIFKNQEIPLICFLNKYLVDNFSKSLIFIIM